MWSGVWGRDESVFGDLSISLSHVLVDFKRLYSTGTRDRGQARVCALENQRHSSKGRQYPKERDCSFIMWKAEEDLSIAIEQMRLNMMGFNIVRIRGGMPPAASSHQIRARSSI